MARPRVLYWFRTDLRLHDSPALTAALDLNPAVLYPVWCWDPHYVFHSLVGPNRWQYLLDSQNDLSASLVSLNPASKLLVVREGATTVLPKLFKAWKISHLVFERDTDTYAKGRDEEVTRMAKEAGVEVVTRYGRTLWDSDEVVKRHKGEPTMTIAQLMKIGYGIGPVPRPLPAPTSIPPPGDTNLEGVRQTIPKQLEEAEDYNRYARDGEDATYHSGLRGPKGDFSPPTMEELNMPAATTPHRGGETIGLLLLNKHLKDIHFTATFSKPETAPTAFNPPATTVLSPHMHFGSVSVRQFYWGVRDVIYGLPKNSKIKPTEPPTSLTGQLYFRDMYFAAQAGLGDPFVRTHGNKTARFMDWYLPSSPSLTGKRYITDNPQAEEWFIRWREGRTGFPWIDAIMTQLRLEGWIHHLARHAVACFLTRGGCYIDWERGADVFEEWLLDHEPACNAGNWQWLSCTAFFSQYHRIYSPVAFPMKTDKSGEFVKRYLPILKDIPEKYIYEPWKCPIADQKAARCRIGVDYPKPMFDWKERREECVKLMKAGFGRGLHGNSDEVMDGSAYTRGRKEVEGGKVETVEEDAQGEADIGAVSEAIMEEGNVTKAEMGKKGKRGQGTLDGVITRKKRKA